MSETLAPETQAQVVELVRWAAGTQTPLAVTGAGTKSGFGMEVDAGARVSLSRLSGILEYEPEELVMSALPGTPLEEIRQVLAAQHQHLAFEPAGLGGICGGADAEATGGTIGGTFLANASGPRRFRSGAARDHILGVRAVSGSGESWKSGGRVIKNVTGYDLSKLLAGSWGTLSIVTELTFKVLPAPQASTTLAVSGLGYAAGLDLVRELAAAPLEAGGLAYLPEAVLPGLPQELRTSREDRGIAFVRVEGSALSVEDRARALEQLSAAAGQVRRLKGDEAVVLWQSVREAGPLLDAEVIVKVSLPPAWAVELTAQLPAGCRWFADAGAGWIWIGIPTRDAVSAVGALRGRLHGRGSCVLWRAPPDLKRKAGVLSPAATAFAALQARIKQSFDPANILNPGRLGVP